MNQIETARHCLRLIRDIADRRTTSSDLANGGYALQELRHVGVESAGAKDRLFEPVPMGATFQIGISPRPQNSAERAKVD
jgi:hypothetical protein